MTRETLSDVAADRIKDARRARGLSTAELAAMCADEGHPEVTQNVIENIEAGRKRNGRRTRDVSVDELAVFAYVLGFPVADLFPGRQQNSLGVTTADQIADLITSLTLAQSLLRNPPPGSLLALVVGNVER